MKQYWIPGLLLALLLCGCTPETISPAATAEPTTAATEPTLQTTEATQPPVGWQEMNGKRYYLFPDGTHPVGWFEDQESTYYIDPNGFAHTGWLEWEENTYFFREDGTMARGEVVIEGVNYHFAADGTRIILVNPWNTVPEDYVPELVALPYGPAVEGMQVDRSCYDALIAMLEACNAEAPRACVVSSYRTQEYQEGLYKRKIARLEAAGCSKEDAPAEAAKVVAVPGTSEHQLGLAVDIVDTRSWSLTEGQAELPAQQWLLENCWKYGFILRYPQGKTEITGIIYEPWHYRYVGQTLAKELYEAGLTLEEYIRLITE